MNTLLGRALLALVEGLVDARVRYRGVYHYRVVAQDGATLELEGVDRELGLPAVKVRPWLSVPGMQVDVEPGTECAVAFLDGNGAKPFVVAFDDANAADVGRGIREGDHIMMPVGQPPVLTATPVVLSQPGATVSPVALAGAGAPGTGYSRAQL